MNSIQNNTNERGSAILMVLGLLSLLLVMALIFAVTSRNAQIVADANADQTQANLNSRSASTRASDALFFFQNKGNLLKSSDLEESMPEGDDGLGELLDQTPHRDAAAQVNNDPYAGGETVFYSAETFYGKRGIVDDDVPILGLQPYVGYVDATTEWNGLALYGEFNHKGYSIVPFGLATASATKDEPYQSIYYSHEDDSYDEVDKENEHSLFEIISKTKLGKAYRVASSNDYRTASSPDPDKAEKDIEDGTSDDKFAELLNNNLSTQLQFREEKDADNHITQRRGFIAFVDGSKFDLNQIVASKMAGDSDEPYVPFVDVVDGEMQPATGNPGTGGTAHLATSTSASTVPSAYAIMGYDYDSTKHQPESIINKLEEQETVQYGLHPQELRVREKSGKAVYAREEVLKRQDKDVPPKWFSYEQLLPTKDDIASQDDADRKQALKDVKAEFLKDIYTLSLASGTEEREYRFTGRYVSQEQMDEFAADDMQNSSAKFFIRKVDLAWPKADYADDGEFLDAETPSWNKISSLVKTRGGLTYDKFFERFSRECLGLHYDSGDSNRYLFKGSGDEDLTQEVLANMIDASDGDNDVTYRWDLDFGSSIGTTDTIPEPSFCGNEMDVPAIMGVNVAVGMDSTKDIVSRTVTRRMFRKESQGGGGFPGGGGGFSMVRIPTFSFTVDGSSSAMTAYYNPKVNLNLQNLLNEEQLSSHKKFRVILKGKIVSALEVKKVSMQYDQTGMGGGGRPGPGMREGQWKATVTNGLTGFSTSTTKDFVECPGTGTTLNAEETAYLTNLAATSANYGVTPGDENASVIQELLNAAEEFTFDKVFTESFDPLDALGNKTVELDMGDFSFNNRKLPDDNRIISGLMYGTNSTPVFYYPTGGVVAVRLDQIVVMAQDDAGDSKMSDIVYAAAPSNTWSIAEGSMGTLNFPVAEFKPFDNFFETRPADGILCKDPRLNHKSKAWKWLSDNDETGSTVVQDLVDHSGTQVERKDHAVTVTDLGTYNFIVKKDDFDGWCDDEFVSKGCWALMEETLGNADRTVAKDWEPGFTPTTGSATDHKMGAALSTAVRLNAPFTSLWQVGSIFRGEIGQTLNLKKFGTDSEGIITHLYEDGDAWLLDYVNLTTLDPGYGVRGKFNPNCFNKGSYRYLFANIPANEDAGESWIYRPGDYTYPDDVTRNTYFRDFVGGDAHGSYVDLEDKVFHFRDEILKGDAASGRTASQNARYNQAWSPVQSFFNFIEIDGGSDPDVQCNDRMAESLIGCTAGLLSTRYETYTVIAVGQSVKWLMPDDAMPSTNRDAFLKQLANPVQLKDGNWYSILSTQVRQITLVRDCWFGTFKVVKSQLLSL